MKKKMMMREEEHHSSLTFVSEKREIEEEKEDRMRMRVMVGKIRKLLQFCCFSMLGST
jgi:hypothetical protein